MSCKNKRELRRLDVKAEQPMLATKWFLCIVTSLFLFVLEICQRTRPNSHSYIYIKIFIKANLNIKIFMVFN